MMFYYILVFLPFLIVALVSVSMVLLFRAWRQKGAPRKEFMYVLMPLLILAACTGLMMFVGSTVAFRYFGFRSEPYHVFQIWTSLLLRILPAFAYTTIVCITQQKNKILLAIVWGIALFLVGSYCTVWHGAWSNLRSETAVLIHGLNSAICFGMSLRLLFIDQTLMTGKNQFAAGVSVVAVAQIIVFRIKMWEMDFNSWWEFSALFLLGILSLTLTIAAFFFYRGLRKQEEVQIEKTASLI